MKGVTKIIIESTKVERREEGREEGRVEGKKSRITMEDCRGHATEASAMLMSSLCLHRSSSLRPSDFDFF